RYARTVPRRPRPASPPRRAGRPAQVRPPSGIAPPQVPVLVLPDGPARASVLPYDVLRRSLAGRGLDVLMMEHRGVGLSRRDSTGRDLPAHAMSLREVIGDLVAVLDHARVEQVAVVGSGYGAYLAQVLAILHPERVHSLVLDSPLTSADDEAIAQRALRDLYWDGAEPATAGTARTLRRLSREGAIDARRAGPVVLAVHEHGGPPAVRELVDLLAVGRGALTWTSVRQVLNQAWLQSTPYLVEHDLTARIAHTELGGGHHADGGPLDPLLHEAEQARAVPPFRGGAARGGAAVPGRAPGPARAAARDPRPDPRAPRHTGPDPPAADSPRPRREDPRGTAARGPRGPPLDPRHPQPDPPGRRPLERLRHRAPAARAGRGAGRAARLGHGPRAHTRPADRPGRGAAVALAAAPGLGAGRARVEPAREGADRSPPAPGASRRHRPRRSGVRTAGAVGQTGPGAVLCSLSTWGGAEGTRCGGA